MKRERSKLLRASELVRSQIIIIDNLDLHKYCHRKTFYTIFLTETQYNDRNALEKLKKVGQNYEDLSCMTFISRDEVWDFYENYEKIKLPNAVLILFYDVCRNISRCLAENQEISPKDFAKLIKMKLLHTMYSQYSSEVKKQRNRQSLEEDLGALIKECKKSKSPSGKKEKSTDNKSASYESKKKDKSKDKGKGKNKEEDNPPEEDADYTTTTIDIIDNIVFEDNIYNCIWFYVFTGFYDTNILSEIAELDFPISAIMSLSSADTVQATDEPDEMFQRNLDKFWENIFERFYVQRQDSFENTFLMKFKIAEEINEDNALDILEKFVYVLRTIVDVKLNHVNYIRHIFIHKRLEEYKSVPVYCFKKYVGGLKPIPFECRNNLFLLNSLLTEVCSRVENETSKSEINSEIATITENENFSNTCVNVFDFTSFSKQHISEPPLKPLVKSSIRSFFCSENDILTIILHSYGKKIGRQMYDTSVCMLNTSSRILKLLDTFENDYRDVVHTHDRDPSSVPLGQDEAYTHFLYLFLFSTFKRECFPALNGLENDITEHLITYDLEQVRKAYEVKTDEDRNKYFSFDDNLYDVAVTDFIYKEHMNTGVLVQALRNAENKFLYCSAKFSPETDNLLVEFQDNLDEFGINTKIYEAPVRTPVCIRDYCRYIVVEENDWIAQNSPPKYVRPTEKLEVCQGLQQVMAQSKFFEEYYYLLDIEEKTDTTPEQVDKVPSDPKITFEDMVAEITNFPMNKNLKDQWGKISNQSKLAYDFGTKYFQLTGCTTTFHSHDGVKVVVDNTSFLGQPQKCTVNLSCKNNELIVHSNENLLNEDFIFHANLSDGILVSFVIKNPKPKKTTKEIKAESSIPEIEKSSPLQSKEEVISEPKNFSYDLEVPCVDRSQFDKIIQNNLSKNAMILNGEDDDDQNEVEEYDSEYNLLQSLKKAVEEGEPIYKVSNEYQYLEKTSKEVKIPLYSIVKRVLCKEVRRKKIGTSIKKYGEDFQGTFKRKVYNPVDFRITFPNGLYITTYPSVSDNPCTEIKQEFLSYESKNSMSHEEFRLFSRDGFILIKKIDATIVILKSNGDFIEFEKPVNTETVSLKPCHCLDINDYIKKLHTILGKKDEDYTFSRRVKVNSKKNKITDENVLEMLKQFNVPYLKKNLLKFNGEKVSIKGNKITLKKKFAMTEEKDFLAEEIFYDRNDGFKCMLNRNGKLQIRFADGTQISSIMEVADDLYDGYVYVSIYFEYEHPNYATVSYRSENSFEVGLNNNVVLNGKEDCVSLNIDDDIFISTTTEEVTYKKSCSECAGIFNCKLNVKPFFENQWKPRENFLYATDSYNKEFFADFIGYCRRNSNYIKKYKNSFDCDHTSRTTYKKLFVVNKDYSGDMFWTENMVQQKKAECENNNLGTINQYKFIKNKKISVVDIRKNMNYPYRDRFLNNDLLYSQFSLQKYLKDEEKPIFYSTARQIFKMLDVDYIKKAIFDVQGVLENECCGCVDEINENLFKNVTKIIEETEEKEASEVVEEEEIPEPLTCKCDQVKIDIKTKIKNWRNERDKYLDLIKNRNIPGYFKSQFCITNE